VLLIGVSPLTADPQHGEEFSLQPQVLSVDEGAVHVEQHGSRQRGLIVRR
jgi:hypothetical protein